MKNIYIAGPLTQVSALTNLTNFYEHIAGICRQFDYNVYVPHLSKKELSFPIEQLTPKRIFDWDTKHLRESDTIIAYVGIASLGVGIELGYAACLNIPVITLGECNVKVSPMVLGHPCLIKHIEFVTEAECYQTLRNILKKVEYE